ncbi:unnamed protein product (macronuclear) [Paramecium tetraurelia]|uniref:Uncharacterized protein n=1 Tax=Paramecium tetraurelia TaxID=5888 RepID=A0BLE8_PARTE|nr:uncharacterized protein GSPATT00029998001 [Paramecium tetraurelia]CAK59365.1 unnamed protein product [Paramecium tetraurelia]|eukprot:XP_001426763.1 hypothetical protein (macronuclear) [Paramecium tetraurelia strain d4-2]
MNQYEYQDCFDDSRLQDAFKQTATFFNPNQSSLKNSITSSKGSGRPQMEYTFKPAQTRLTQHESQQSLGKRNNGQIIQNKPNAQPPKITSPVKVIKGFSQKPQSPPQLYESRNKVTYQEQIKRIKETDIRDEFIHIYSQKEAQPPKPIQKNIVGSRVLRSKIEGSSNTADSAVRVQFHTKQNEQDNVRLSSDQMDFPSYKKSLLESDRFNNRQNLNDLLRKSNSTAFLPQIQSKLSQAQNIPYGYGPISQQETAIRTNSSKQTIPGNEILYAQPEDSQMRKSKTAQETMRESGGQQIQGKIQYKLNNAESQDVLPQIHSPNQGTQQGFSQSKGRSFLQRKPQAKIISRLFSSKSDNKNN